MLVAVPCGGGDGAAGDLPGAGGGLRALLRHENKSKVSEQARRRSGIYKTLNAILGKTKTRQNYREGKTLISASANGFITKKRLLN